MKTDNTKRRDWSLIIFILPIGILLMLLAGQLAIRMSPSWLIDGEISSNLDPETASKQQALIVRPVSNDILTPMSWWDTFLTPGAGDGDVSYAPFVVFVPTSTPTLKPTATNTPVVTATSQTPTATVTKTLTPTKTKKPPEDTPTPTSKPTTCTDPSATNNGGPLPCTYPPTTCTDPAATNNGGPLPCTYPPTTCTDPAATNNGGPLPCTYPPTATLVSQPVEVNIGTPDGSIGNLPDNNYFVLDLGSNPIVVNGPAETNYDLVYYEKYTGSGINMDKVILSISNDQTKYYVVFNWGDGVPDSNSNVGDVASSTGTEDDNQPIASSELHGSPPLQTGILVDVDNAPSSPPPGSYQYLAIQAPTAAAPPPPPPPGGDTSLDVDAIEVTEVSPPPPTP